MALAGRQLAEAQMIMRERADYMRGFEEVAAADYQKLLKAEADLAAARADAKAAWALIDADVQTLHRKHREAVADAEKAWALVGDLIVVSPCLPLRQPGIETCRHMRAPVFCPFHIAAVEQAKRERRA